MNLHADNLTKKYVSLIATNTIPNSCEKIDISPLIVETLRKHL